MKIELQELVQKEMNRTVFLQHVGLALLALTGVAAIVKALNTFGNRQPVANGFGGGAYGGINNSRR